MRPSIANGWEDFRYYYRLYPQFAPPMDLVYDLQEQACNIYVSRVEAGPDTPPMTDLVEQFKKTINALPPGSPAEHTLVFPTFIAALESSVPEQQAFFLDLLQRHYQRNGFANIRSTVNYLEWFWARRSHHDWTELLPDFEVFIV